MQAFNTSTFTLDPSRIDHQVSKPANVTSSTFRLKPSPFMTCFVTTIQPNLNSHEEGFYHIRLINKQTQQFYCYELNRSHHAFEIQLFDQLQHRAEPEIWHLLLSHGDFVLDSEQKAFDLNADKPTLDGFSSEQLRMLNPEAVAHLKGLGLRMVPSLYHWIIEPNNKRSRQLRQQALSQYTIFLLLKMTPNFQVYFDNPHHQTQPMTFFDLVMSNINHSIDHDLPLGPLIAATFGFSEAEVKQLCEKPYAQLTDDELSAIKLNIMQTFAKANH